MHVGGGAAQGLLRGLLEPRVIGEEAGSRACTATVVDQWWIATAASCFAHDPRRPGGLAAGRPAV
ncbi:hypothetical protein OG311_32280 [Streptomyces sp. NBC_01343]|uniref:hypothetical protein n=1 Tax=Streptomyces sp. NBC_01343 TaxID=2903832 RepID=UPI002E0E9C14|nr:hypothetical protein OG311_32280 [Streptomyces sp. NBC_01343]